MIVIHNIDNTIIIIPTLSIITMTLIFLIILTGSFISTLLIIPKVSVTIITTLIIPRVNVNNKSPSNLIISYRFTVQLLS